MTNAGKAARAQPEIQPIAPHLLASDDHRVIGVWNALTAPRAT
jgi:hypothetical protein